MGLNSKIKFHYFALETPFWLKRELELYKSPLPIDDKKGTLLIAHRGLSCIHRENTLASFKAAGKLGYFGIETDVHVTADGKYVVIHDDTTGRVAEKDISVEGSTFDDLSKIRIKPKRGEDTSDGTRIPSLQEYIQVCKDCSKVGVLELKNHFEPKNVYEILDVIDKMGYLEHMIFISFDLANCIAIRAKYASVPVQYLTTRYDEQLLDTLKKEKLDVDIYCFELNKKRVDALHQAGVKINCWTGDSPRFVKKLIGWGVDYVTTNVCV